MKNTVIGAVIGGGLGFFFDRSLRSQPTTEEPDTADATEENTDLHIEFPPELSDLLQQVEIYFGNQSSDKLRDYVQDLLSKPKRVVTLTQKSERIIETVRIKYQIKSILTELSYDKLSDYDRLKASETVEQLFEIFDDSLGNYISDLQLTLS